MNKRLVGAFTAYGILGVVAFFLLKGTALYAILILFGYFAARTLIAHKAGWQNSKSEHDDRE